MKDAVRDLLPIAVIITVFQVLILRQPIPNLPDILFGSVFVVVGLTLFVKGLEYGLFPIGENMAYALAEKGSVFWLMVFSFALGFSTTVAEPALIAIGNEAARVAAEANLLPPGEGVQEQYAYDLRIAVALSVGFAIMLGVFRILKGWPLHYFILSGYVLVSLLTPFAPEEIIGIAYDAGGVTTSTVTVPLVTALGVGLATSIKGRNPMIDGFGLIAFASLLPMFFVMGFGVLMFGLGGG
ncbi:MAG: DUF1538 domain-containing protein [Magnetococcales bacterium]|nr:DUF1538 domain-containing protein [Magnetococcales bacterium]